MCPRLLIRIEESLHHRGMGARQGKPFCQIAEALEIPVTLIALATYSRPAAGAAAHQLIKGFTSQQDSRAGAHHCRNQEESSMTTPL